MVILNTVIITVLWTLCASEPHQVQQLESFQTAKLGETVVIKCSTRSAWNSRAWYKLDTNRSLQLLTTTVNLPETKAVNHYLVQSSSDETTLTIMNMTAEDVGTYYCGIVEPFYISFGSGTVLKFEGESKLMQSVLQSPDYIRVQPGDSVTLSCSFNTSLCSKDHISVTWIKGSASETISWNNINEVVCDIHSNTEETSCVHNMTLANITSTADGIYLCVVTVCGHMQTGTGTRMLVPDGGLSEFGLSSTVIILTVLNVVFCVAVVVLVWVVYSYRKNQHTEDSSPGSSGSNGEQVEGEVLYTGLNVLSWSAPHRSNTVLPRQDTVVYSQVKNQQD
ncbi:uncharacterized protein LOC129409827 [Boleophthalmus pectinirostris]|uniref:uncharacterized protein LOC129409827 n=1 Tax=Boleophthalmus pectinirostris TaxID=150288 RepID=UPI0024329D49|nr:uncharacterized protein LOC129409827 [Boleophthalmus pectinirostris]